MRQIRKMFTFSAHVLFYFLAGRWLIQAVGGAVGSAPIDALSLAGKCLVLSGIHLTVIYVLFVHILRSYGNVFTRILAMEGLLLGVPLSAVALFAAANGLLTALAAASLAAWLYFAYRYRANKARYEIQGAGPVPVDTCIRIPVELPRPGDAIGTGGLMARLLRQGVAHTETVIPWEGKLMLFSSWFENGAFLNEVPRILKPDPKYPNYLLQRRPALRQDQVELMEYVVRAMIKQNAAYVERLKARRARLPAFLRNWLDKKFPVTGYDWLGRYTGRRAPDHWTCNVVYLEVMRRSGVEVVRLGHGAAGLRTGWFDIPNTEDLRGDEALHLVRNAEVPELLAEGRDCPTCMPTAKVPPDPDFERAVERLVQYSTNIFAHRKSST
ncbi:MAG: hypothetical protein JST01_18610 [Cyanobacteria bacterium SZAS TMP-1]|nr:hypothetical protein [Cyanobacteria bacterium SZAS TMP-1]